LGDVWLKLEDYVLHPPTWKVKSKPQGINFRAGSNINELQKKIFVFGV